ncbi:CCAAT-binding factor, subunit B [Pseudoloma neurophilia]|uniref:Transcriptional activator HAP2 n=1 Tax=Pseudoloma neurophilia TaxID=146866 RepID=A0A0R0M5I5_9MICR|nr:CCAAT-binding factor, subunit B [Pseudoloma neurophilia]
MPKDDNFTSDPFDFTNSEELTDDTKEKDKWVQYPANSTDGTNNSNNMVGNNMNIMRRPFEENTQNVQPTIQPSNTRQSNLNIPDFNGFYSFDMPPFYESRNDNFYNSGQETAHGNTGNVNIGPNNVNTGNVNIGPNNVNTQNNANQNNTTAQEYDRAYHATPSFENQQQSSFENPQQSSFENPQQPAFENQQQPAFENPQQPAFENPQQPFFTQGIADIEQPLYVNAHQFNCIRKRKLRRDYLDTITVNKNSLSYLHESRHRHAMNRLRAPSGRFLTKEEAEVVRAQQNVENDEE